MNSSKLKYLCTFLQLEFYDFYKRYILYFQSHSYKHMVMFIDGYDIVSHINANLQLTKLHIH